MGALEGEEGEGKGGDCAPTKKLVGFRAILNVVGTRQNEPSNIIYLPS